MILPIGHAEMRARRWPIVTMVLLVGCVVMQVAYGRFASEALWDRGWVRVLSAMWFLLLCGMTLEDRWGRLVFSLFCVVCGAAAALVPAAASLHRGDALLAAWGVVAGCMGAFAFAFARTPVRFVWLLAFRPRVFRAPAYVVLPAWAAIEAAWLLAFGGKAAAGSARVEAVAFALGVLAAALLRRSGLDRRLDDAVERAATLGGDPRIEEARMLVRQGQPEMALAMLEGLAEEKPSSPHVHDALAEAARALGRGERAGQAEERAAWLRRSVR